MDEARCVSLEKELLAALPDYRKFEKTFLNAMIKDRLGEEVRHIVRNNDNIRTALQYVMSCHSADALRRQLEKLVLLFREKDEGGALALYDEAYKVNAEIELSSRSHNSPIALEERAALEWMDELVASRE